MVDCSALYNIGLYILSVGFICSCWSFGIYIYECMKVVSWCHIIMYIGFINLEIIHQLIYLIFHTYNIFNVISCNDNERI